MENIQDTQFTSLARYEHIAIKNHISASVTNVGGTNISIQHNLGYIPFAKLRVQLGSDSNIYPVWGGATFYLDGYEITNYSFDTNNINMTLFGPSSTATTMIIYYKIYAEPQI